MRFYALSEKQRVTLTKLALKERRTLIERWSALEKSEAQPWSERSAKAATYLKNCASVADFGCGLMQLRNYLEPGVRYVPVDVVARDQNTIVLDFNTQPLPILDVDGYAVLGLLEYLFDVPNFLRQLSGTVVTTYNALDLTAENRLAHGWVNEYSSDELESMFSAAGMQMVAKERLGNQFLWMLRR